ncbi:hypothetical protein RB200_02415 [Streptomyces sp. PmtG]
MNVPVRIDAEDGLSINNRPHRLTWDRQGTPPALWTCWSPPPDQQSGQQ